METKESLIRDNFSLSTPIKCSCGMLHPRNKPRADWLAQRGGYCDRRGAGSIPRGLKIFSWDCMALCGAVAGPCCLGLHGTVRGCRWTLLLGFFMGLHALTFSVWRSLDVLPLLVFTIFARWMFSRFLLLLLFA